MIRPGCSGCDFVEPHTGKEILVRFDLEDYFPLITAARVLQIFLTAGYPESVARALTRLATHAAPPSVLEEKALTGWNAAGSAGLVLNEKPNIDRREFDRFKAILTNCARHGPASQNRGNHPNFAIHRQGKLAWVRFIHPGKEVKLRTIFERIDWKRAK